jgi:hypothetical protein
MMLTEPDVLPIVFVGRDRQVHLTFERQVLGRAIVGGRPGDVPVYENAELHLNLLDAVDFNPIVTLYGRAAIRSAPSPTPSMSSACCPGPGQRPPVVDV